MTAPDPTIERARQQAAVMSDIQWLRLVEKNAEFERRMR